MGERHSLSWNSHRLSERRWAVATGGQRAWPPPFPAILRDAALLRGFSGVDKRHRPYFFARRRVRPVFDPSVPPAPTEGARDARVPGAIKSTQNARTKILGPTDLDASRHRGLSKSFLPQVRQTQGVPRAVFVRLAPQRPRWTSLSGNPSLLRQDCEAAYPPLAARGSGRAGTAAAWTAGPPRRISSVMENSPATAPRFTSEDA